MWRACASQGACADVIGWPPGVKPHLPSLFEVGSLHPCISQVGWPAGLWRGSCLQLPSPNRCPGITGAPSTAAINFKVGFGDPNPIISPTASLLFKFFTRLYLHIICVVKIKRNQ